MNKELKLRLNYSKEKFDCHKSELEASSKVIQSAINNFGLFRENSLKEVIGRYITCINQINQKHKDTQYDIPIDIECIYNITTPEFKTSEAIEKAKEQLYITSWKAVGTSLNTMNAALQKYASRTYPNFTPTPTTTHNNSGPFWLELITDVCNLFSAKIAKDEAERTEVERYCRQTDIAIEKINNQISFNKKILERIYELHQISLDLYELVKSSLSDFEAILYTFDISNDEHIVKYQKLTALVISFSKISKLQILDDKNELSAFDATYIINSKKILSRDFLFHDEYKNYLISSCISSLQNKNL